MAIAMASVTVAAGVQPLNAVASSSHAHLASASRLGGFRLNNEGVSLRTAGRPATVVVRAEEGVTDKVHCAAGDAARGEEGHGRPPGQAPGGLELLLRQGGQGARQRAGRCQGRREAGAGAGRPGSRREPRPGRQRQERQPRRPRRCTEPCRQGPECG